MRVTRLALTDFTSHADTTLDLSDVHTAVVTGPVGAGKSTLIEAITWALFGDSRATTLDQLIREGTDSCRVEVDLDVDGRHLSVVREKPRGKDALLSLTVDDEVATGHTSAETKAIIARHIGIGLPALLAGPFMLQDDPGSFMGLSPADRKVLLLSLLDAERWAIREKEVALRSAAARATVNMAADRLAKVPADLDARLAQAQEAVGNAMAAQARAQGQVHAWREALDEAIEEHARQKERYAQAAVLDDRLTDIRDRFKAARYELQQADEAFVARVAEVERIEQARPAEVEEQPDVLAERARDALRSLIRVESAYEAAKNAVDGLGAEVACPECGTIFTPGAKDADALRAAVEHAETEVAMARDFHEERQSAVAAAAAWQSWQERHASTVSLRDAAQAFAAGARSATTRLADEGRRLKAERDAMEDQSERLAVAIDVLNRARSAVTKAESDVAEARDDLDKASREQARLEALWADAAATLALSNDATKEHATMSTLAKAFGRDGIPTMLLEAVLPAIEYRANLILARMPGGFSLSLRTQRITKTGTPSETLDVMVDPGTGSERAYAMLSGGQRFRVDLALRLGLTATLATRRFDTLVMDEGLDRWQDPEGRDALLETLAAVAPDFGLVLVVAHNPSVIERFATQIAVAQDEDRISRVTI